MIDWNTLISSNKKAVVDFATHKSSANDFQQTFAGNPNFARRAIRNHNALYARRLARKALRRRNLLKN